MDFRSTPACNKQLPNNIHVKLYKKKRSSKNEKKKKEIFFYILYFVIVIFLSYFSFILLIFSVRLFVLERREPFIRLL